MAPVLYVAGSPNLSILCAATVIWGYPEIAITACPGYITTSPFAKFLGTWFETVHPFFLRQFPKLTSFGTVPPTP